MADPVSNLGPVNNTTEHTIQLSDTVNTISSSLQKLDNVSQTLLLTLSNIHQTLQALTSLNENLCSVTETAKELSFTSMELKKIPQLITQSSTPSYPNVTSNLLKTNNITNNNNNPSIQTAPYNPINPITSTELLTSFL